MQMPPKVKKIWEIASTVIVVLFVLAAVFLLGSRLLGYQVYTVISGSMDPKYKVGDLVYVKQVDPTTIQKGDDITFVLEDGKTVATHRVHEVNVKGNDIYFTTYGIANLTAEEKVKMYAGEEFTPKNLDKPVWHKNVQGVVKFSIPLLGYVSDYISSPPGTWVAIGGVTVLIVLAFLPDIISYGKKGDKSKQETAESKQDPEQ